MFGWDQSTIDSEKVNKLERWIPYQTTYHHMQVFLIKMLSIQKLLLAMKSGSYMFTICVLEDLLESEVKNDLHLEKVMLSICWNFQEILYWELLSRNYTIDAKLIWKFEDCTTSNWRKIRLLDDNARVRTAKILRQKLEESGRKVETIGPENFWARARTRIRYFKIFVSELDDYMSRPGYYVSIPGLGLDFMEFDDSDTVSLMEIRNKM